MNKLIGNPGGNRPSCDVEASQPNKDYVRPDVFAMDVFAMPGNPIFAAAKRLLQKRNDKVFVEQP